MSTNTWAQRAPSPRSALDFQTLKKLLWVCSRPGVGNERWRRRVGGVFRGDSRPVLRWQLMRRQPPAPPPEVQDAWGGRERVEPRAKVPKPARGCQRAQAAVPGAAQVTPCPDGSPAPHPPPPTSSSSLPSLTLLPWRVYRRRGNTLKADNSIK